MDIEFLRMVLDTPGIGMWIRIMSWGFVLGWIFTFTRLLKGGFNDITEISRSPYASARERWQARFTMPGRFIALILASGVGTAGVAIGLLVQGSIVIFIYQEVFAGG
jgi:hypothetical protein